MNTKKKTPIAAAPAPPPEFTVDRTIQYDHNQQLELFQRVNRALQEVHRVERGLREMLDGKRSRAGVGTFLKAWGAELHALGASLEQLAVDDDVAAAAAAALASIELCAVKECGRPRARGKLCGEHFDEAMGGRRSS